MHLRKHFVQSYNIPLSSPYIFYVFSEKSLLLLVKNTDHFWIATSSSTSLAATLHTKETMEFVSVLPSFIFSSQMNFFSHKYIICKGLHITSSLAENVSKLLHLCNMLRKCVNERECMNTSFDLSPHQQILVMWIQFKQFTSTTLCSVSSLSLNIIIYCWK